MERYALCLQQRFEEMESKISDLRDQIETIKAEKNLLEKRTQTEFKVCHNKHNFLFIVTILSIMICNVFVRIIIK